MLLVTNKSKEIIYCNFRVRIFKHRVLVEKLKGKRPHGRHRHRWEDHFKMDVEKVGWGSWTGLIWFRIGTGDRHL